MQAGTTLKFRELQIKLHADREDFHLEDFIVVSSENSQSGNWEVWQLDREGEDQAKRFEDIEFLPSDRLLEIISEETLTEGSIYDILCAIADRIPSRRGKWREPCSSLISICVGFSDR